MIIISKIINNFVNYKISFCFIFLFILLHLLYINTPFVNHEWVYRVGSEYFFKNDASLLTKYFENQANPISYSFISSLLYYFLEDDYYIYRLPALFGALILLVSIHRSNNIWLLLITGLNPLIWIYSGRAYSEMLSLGLMILAINIKKNLYLNFVTGLSSIVIKYHALPFLFLHSGITCILQNIRSKSFSLNSYIKSNIAILFGFIIFLIFYYKLFGIFLIPENFSSQHFIKFNFNTWLINFFSYGFYLSGMFFFTLPAFLKLGQLKTKLFLLGLCIILAINNKNSGEMDFGSFQQFLGVEIILLIKIIGFWNFLLCCQAFWKDEDSRIMLLTILGYIVLLSLTRPVNRYLIFVIPFWAILIYKHILLSSILWWVYVSILAGLNVFASVYQVSNATASANMAQWAVQNNVRINLGGILRAHVGDFSHYDPKSNLVVSLEGSHTGKVLHEESVMVFGFPIRSYVLTKTSSSSGLK